MSRELATRTGLPIIHLDKEFWNAGWIESDMSEFSERVSELYKADEWIVDGNYSSTMDERLSRSDTVFHLDYSTPRCFWRVLKRIVLTYGKVREDCAEGCPERFDLEFLVYVLRFRKKFRSRTIETLQKNPHLKVHRFQYPKQLARFLAESYSES